MYAFGPEMLWIVHVPNQPESVRDMLSCSCLQCAQARSLHKCLETHSVVVLLLRLRVGSLRFVSPGFRSYVAPDT